MTDIRHIAGDMPLSAQARMQLTSFITRNQVVVVTPAKRHAAGWIWTGRLGEAVAVAGDHEPLRVLTVPAEPAPHIVRFVACLAMRGEIDHVLQVTPAFTRMQPVDDPKGMRETIKDELPDWWECPYSDKTRCICISPHNSGSG